MHCKKNYQQAWTCNKSLLYDNVKVQSFFRTGGLQKYFVVATDVAANQDSTVVEEIVAEQLAEYQSTQQQIKEDIILEPRLIFALDLSGVLGDPQVQATTISAS